MMKLKYGGFAAFLLIAVFAACTNTALDELLGGGGNGSRSVTTRYFRVDAVAGLSVGDAGDEHCVAALTVPEREGPWAVELVEEVDHNHLFVVNVLEQEEPEEGDEEAVVMYEVAIAKGETLEWGPYQISIRISNEAGKAFFKTIQFEVSETPAPFKRAPSVYPWIVEPGKNKLNILWESVSGAEGYHIYVGETSTKPATATKTGISETTVEITDIKGNSATGVLPDSTTYYVWVEAYNGSGGSLSPSAQRMTTATVQPYWYEGVAKHDCLYGDRYYVTQTTIQYQFGEENPLNYNYIGDIVYHSEWKEEDGATWPRKDNTGKHNEKYTNKPQGVFVIKYQSPVLPIALDPKQNKLYSAVYYWGMDVDAYAGSGHTDKRQAYMVNQWNNYAERTSLEAAIDYFTCANANTFIKMGPEPYIRFMSE